MSRCCRCGQLASIGRSVQAVSDLALLVSELAAIVSDVSARGGDGQLATTAALVRRASNDREAARISRMAVAIRGLAGREEGDDQG